MTWTLESEKHFIQTAVKNWGFRRRFICDTPEQWLGRYLNSLFLRHVGPAGQPMTNEHRYVLRQAAEREMKRLGKKNLRAGAFSS